jgi:hypothetical protein
VNARILRIAGLFAAGAALAVTTVAHHSYSMFDFSKVLTVTGTVAKHEWINPHSYIWVYAPSASQPGKQDLYAFENAAPGTLLQSGWSKDALRAGDRLTVEYSPLRDGRTGGHCVRVTLADGRTLRCSGGPPARPATPSPEARP